MNKPLLSITIPTWNRASFLDTSLSILLPQLIKYKEIIELIISDNCSTDNTKDVVESYIKQYNEFSIQLYEQTENTGYYGNFKKCRELANGTYFWLLSDNEFLNIGLIKYLVESINKNPNVSSIYLRDWSDYLNSDSLNKSEYTKKLVSNEDLIKEAGYKLTLISAVIFKNSKENDNEIFKRFKGNSFLGFVLFLNALKEEKISMIISGVSLLSKFTPISFNVFKSFTIDMDECLIYGIEQKMISNVSKEMLMNNIIKNLTQIHYTEYKIYGKIYGKNMGDIDSVNELLTKYLNQYGGFDKYLRGKIKRNKNILKCQYFLNKIFRTLNLK